MLRYQVTHQRHTGLDEFKDKATTTQSFIKAFGYTHTTIGSVWYGRKYSRLISHGKSSVEFVNAAMNFVRKRGWSIAVSGQVQVGGGSLSCILYWRRRIFAIVMHLVHSKS